MTLDIERHVNGVLKIKENTAEYGKYWREYMHHHWLRGFKEIAEENYLDKGRTKEFLDERTLQHTQFSRLTSSSFLRSHEKLVRENRLISLWLPVDNSCHLQIFALMKDKKMKLLYEKCKRCRAEYFETLPCIQLKRSMDLSGMTNGVMIDTEITPWQQRWEEMKGAYETMEEFVKAIRVY